MIAFAASISYNTPFDIFYSEQIERSLSESAHVVHNGLNKLTIYSHNPWDALLEIFLAFRCYIASSTKEDKMMLDVLLADLERITSYLDDVFKTDELSSKENRYEQVMNEIDNAYNTLSDFIFNTMELQKIYHRHAEALVDYQKKLLDFSDQFLFTYDKELGEILGQLETAFKPEENNPQD